MHVVCMLLWHVERGVETTKTHYVRAFTATGTTAAVATTITEAKIISAKLSGNVEGDTILSKNTLATSQERLNLLSWQFQEMLRGMLN